jgi:hypothetical protein
MAASVEIGTDEYVTWDKRVPVVRSAVVTGATGTTTYSWNFTSRPTGSTATLSGATSGTASFTPDKPGAYVLSCTITNNGVQANDNATVTVRPTHWVRKSGAKSPATMRAKVSPLSVVSSTVESTV